MNQINNRIGGKTARYALLGEKLPHTFSPQIHNTLFDAYGLDAIYFALPFAKEAMRDVMGTIRACFAGCNVTIPYKELVIPYVDELDDTAKKCGAVNTIANHDGCLVGYNTDGIGFLRALTEKGIHPSSSMHAIILGSGGTARITMQVLREKGVHVRIAARNPSMAKRLCDEFGGEEVIPLESGDLACDLLVNTTPVGMYQSAQQGSPIKKEALKGVGAVYDAIFNPPKTQLLVDAQEKGIMSISGLSMLVYQAVHAQHIWFGRKPENNILNALMQELEGLGENL